jgi:RHS repeat-associated protein
VALYKSKSNSTEETRYLHKDHLGSITVITDEAGAVAEELSYDPHGKRRNPDWSDALAQLQSFETKRSFTGHLYLDDVGLIHMGGRYYDPELGRFLSADPFIQEPANAQSLNRYSYVLNNPLSYTDPSGFFFSKIFKAIKSVFKAVANVVKSVVSFVKDNIRTIAAIAVSAIIPNPYIAGFAAGLIASGGDLKAGIIGALTAGAFEFIGHSQVFGDFLKGFGGAAGFVKSLAHGVVGGISQEIGGGNFLSGFLSAGFVQGIGNIPGLNSVFGTSNPVGFGDYAHNAVAAAVIGGTASVLGGGKFKNGAITGAFSRLFNDVSKNGFELRKKDAYPDKYTNADVLADAVDTIVNSPDGNIKIYTGQGWITVTKLGTTVSYISDQITISGNYQINDDGSLSVSIIDSQIPLSYPQSAHIHSDDFGTITVDIEYKTFLSVGPRQIIYDEPPNNSPRQTNPLGGR